MKKQVNILVSNIGLPSEKIGSWVTRFNFFLKHNDVFDFILSPSNISPNYIYCRKRKFITYNKYFRSIMLRKWVAKEYLQNILKISKYAEKLVVFVIDDFHLVEAILLLKKKKKLDIYLIFSFHGHKLIADENVVNQIDKILFLTELGYQATKNHYHAFVPMVEIVGNSVNSKDFFCLDIGQKEKLKKSILKNSNDIIITWLSNDRKEKGLHIFKEIIKNILQSFDNITIQVIGSKEIIQHPKVVNVGRISNNKIPSFLQISDMCIFTSLVNEGFGLSVIEAYKTGNLIITSERGGIKEVLKELNNVYYVKNENVVSEWIEIISRQIRSFSPQKTPNKTDIWEYEEWEKKILKSINLDL